MIVQCATFSKSLNPRNIDKSVSDIQIRIRFPFESIFWISGSGCKLTILPDIQPASRIVIMSVRRWPEDDWLNLGNARVFIRSAASVSSILIGWFSRLETSLLFSTNHVREWFSGGTGSSVYRFRRNPKCFPLLFVFIRLNREYHLHILSGLLM